MQKLYCILFVLLGILFSASVSIYASEPDDMVPVDSGWGVANGTNVRPQYHIHIINRCTSHWYTKIVRQTEDFSKIQT